MRRLILLIVLCSLAVTSPLTAQSASSASSVSDYGVAAIRPLYEMVKRYVMASAEQMPAEKYAYRPTPEVRSFGEILGHVASDQYFFCSSAKGEQKTVSSDLEKLAKAEMLVALRESFEYCDPLYSMPGSRAAEEVGTGGQRTPRLYFLDYNATHDWEHYGNLITYFRLNGMVPPSSQGGG